MSAPLVSPYLTPPTGHTASCPAAAFTAAPDMAAPAGLTLRTWVALTGAVVLDGGAATRYAVGSALCEDDYHQESIFDDDDAVTLTYVDRRLCLAVLAAHTPEPAWALSDPPNSLWRGSVSFDLIRGVGPTAPGRLVGFGQGRERSSSSLATAYLTGHALPCCEVRWIVLDPGCVFRYLADPDPTSG